MKWLLLESATPSDLETIMASFHSDVSDEKFSPTTEFLKIAYDKLNSELFGNELPSNIDLVVKSAPSQSFFGRATATIYRRSRKLTPKSIILNGSATLTLHEWLEVVVHEMVHIADYSFHPEHFFGRKYDAHGTWFLDFGKKFEKDGFHVQKYCNAEYGINTDDKKVKKQMNDMLLIEFSPGEIIRVSPTMKYKVVNILEAKRYKNLKFWTTENPLAVKLSQWRPRDRYSTLRYYHFTDAFKEKYGPFKEITMNPINEDKDEVEYDDMNHIDDDYAKHLYDNIKGVVDVEKRSDDEYIVTII